MLRRSSIFKGTTIGSPMRFLTEAIRVPGGDECVLWPFVESGGGYAMVSCNGEPILACKVCLRTNQRIAAVAPP